MSLREDFEKLKVGDIFYADYLGRSGNLGAAICLVTGVDDKVVSARTITTHLVLRFEKNSLMGHDDGNSTDFVVRSTKQLPKEIYKLCLELDWKHDPANPVQEPRPTEAQKDALLFLADHYGYAVKVVQLEVSRVGHQTIYRVTVQTMSGSTAANSGWSVTRAAVPTEAEELAKEWCERFSQTTYDLIDHRT